MKAAWFLFPCFLFLVPSLLPAGDEMQVDEKARRISFPAKVGSQGQYADKLKGAVEYLACCVGGKEYESVFVCNVNPQALYEALIKMGLKQGMPQGEDDAGNYRLPKGRGVRILVEWTEGGQKKGGRAESFVSDAIHKKPMVEVDWPFTGSREVKDPATGNTVIQAALSKHLVSLHHKDATVLMQNPLLDAQDDTRYRANKAALPKEGSPVTMIFEIAPPPKIETPPGHRRIHLMISGTVQGVGFREFTQRNAKMAGIRGWVRNLPSGDVELEAEGPEAAIKEFEAKMQKGPRGSKVDKVAAVKRHSGEALEEFEIRLAETSK